MYRFCLFFLFLFNFCFGKNLEILQQKTLTGLETRVSGAEIIIGENSNRLAALENEAIEQSKQIKNIRNSAEVVKTEVELTTAIPLGGTIILEGDEIKLSSPIIITKEGTKITSKSRNTKLILPHSEENIFVIHVAAPNVTIEGIKISANHPLTVESKSVQSIGISVSSTNGVDTNGLIIRDCEIYNVFGGIWRYPGNQVGETAKNWLIENNKIYSFAHSGIHLNWKYENIKIINNLIHGRKSGENHVVYFNGMWLGNYFDRSLVGWNDISRVDRHAIEIWNSDSAPANINGNYNCQVIGNNIHDIGEKSSQIDFPVGSFGISAFGNGTTSIIDNLIENYIGIGIEIYNDKVNLGRTLVRGGIIKGGRSGTTATGMTIHGGLEVDIDNVTFVDIQSTTRGNESWGIDVRPRVGIGASGLRIHNCKFENAGNRMIYINGDGIAKFERVTISNNEFYYKSRPWMVPSGQYSAVYIQRGLSDIVLRDNKSWYSTSLGVVGGYQLEDGSLLTAVIAGLSSESKIRGQFRSCQGSSNLLIPF